MLEEKVEALTTEVVALRKTLEQAMPGLMAAAGGAESSEADEGEKKKPAAKKPAAKKPAAKKAPEPDHDADEVAAIMRRAAKEVDKAKVQEYIGEQDCADLAELLTKPELFDAAYDFAAELLGEDGEEESEDDDI